MSVGGVSDLDGMMDPSFMPAPLSKTLHFTDYEQSVIALTSRNVTKGPRLSLRLKAAAEMKAMKIAAGIIKDPNAPPDDDGSAGGESASAEAPAMVHKPLVEADGAARAAAAAAALDPNRTQRSADATGGVASLYHSSVARRLQKGTNEPLQVEVNWSRLQYSKITGHQAIPVLCDEADTVLELKEKIFLRQQMLLLETLQPDRMLLFLRSVVCLPCPIVSRVAVARNQPLHSHLRAAHFNRVDLHLNPGAICVLHLSFVCSS